MDYSRYDYEERAKNCDEQDFWGQVRRTINGKAVPESQISLICESIQRGMNFSNQDCLLDVGCGNGALTYRFKDDVKNIIGVDRSHYLIKIANKHFLSDNIAYECGDILDLLESLNTNQVNKVLIYGVFSFFTDKIAKDLIRRLINAGSINTIYIGNNRDIDLAEKFYNRNVTERDLKDHTTSMGVWRNTEFFERLADELNLGITVSRMPSEFYASGYYFDVTFNYKSL